jgi:TRAP-type C4-dicarboxylate transport system substrate-binding protein
MRFLRIAAACIVASLVSFSAIAQPTLRMNVTAGHPPVFNWVSLIDTFVIPEVEKRTAGKAKFEWNKAYGGTVAKLGAESDALRTGISDIGVVASIFEAGKFPLQQVTLQVPFGTPDMRIVTRIAQQLHDRLPELQETWTRQNLVLLGVFCVDDYALVTKFPVQSVADLNGKKLFVPGPVASWLQGTGAVAVSGNLNTYYNGIQTGVADGAVVSTANIWGIKLHEVAPHVTRAGLGAQFVGALAMNKGVFDKLPKDVQEVFRQVGREYGEQMAIRQQQLVDQVQKDATAQGAKYTDLSEAERVKWANALPNLPVEWGKQLDAKGLAGTKVARAYLEALQKEGVKLPRDWLK